MTLTYYSSHSEITSQHFDISGMATKSTQSVKNPSIYVVPQSDKDYRHGSINYCSQTKITKNLQHATQLTSLTNKSNYIGDKKNFTHVIL